VGSSQAGTRLPRRPSRKRRQQRSTQQHAKPTSTAPATADSTMPISSAWFLDAQDPLKSLRQ
jgi:hypothetical protein